MTSSKKQFRPFSVAVVGATGHTGRFVVAELLRRGIIPIAIVRSLESLRTANFASYESGSSNLVCRAANLEDPASLDRALEGVQAVINCAGPFLDTADAVIGAALRAGIHYLDLAAEQASALATLDRYDPSARESGVVVIPAMGFYGGFADLLVTTILGDWDAADSIDVMIGLDSWHPTRGTRITGQRNTVPRVALSAGRLVPIQSPPGEKDWEFVAPLGHQAMVELPFSEIILISRHIRSDDLHTWLSSNALGDIRNSLTPAPQPADPAGRSAQRFVVDVVVKRDGKTRRISALGRDIYAFSAPLICEVVEHLLKGKFSETGAHPPGAILNAREILSALSPDELTLEY